MPTCSPSCQLHLAARLAVATVLTVSICMPAVAATPIVINVDPGGSDAANGDAATGPVKTLKRAQAIARTHLSAMAAGGAPRAPVRVLIGPGTYALDAPLAFTPLDSGTAEAPVSYEAKQAGSVRLSGGVDLGSKTASAGGTKLSFAVPTDPVASNGGSQLFVNGRRAILARQPNINDAWFVQSAVHASGEAAGKQGMQAFTAAPSNLSWISGLSAADRKRAIVEVYQSWTTGKHRFSNPSTTDGSVRITPRALWPFLSLGGSSQRYFIENVVAALDAPGEWIYDDGAARYIARTDEAGKALQATLPMLEKLVTVQGDAAKPVSHLHLIGLTLSYTRYLTPETGVTDNQAGYIVGAAIEVNRATDFVFSGGRVEHTGGWGIWLREGVRDATIIDSTFVDVGAGGIKVGLAAQAPGDSSATGANHLIGNTISQTGQVFPSAVGIFVGQSWDNEVLRNTIHDTTYTGISVGWTWGYGPATSGRNLVKGNLIYNIGQRQLADLAGIYTLGRSPDTVIANNIIRNVRGYSGYGAGAWGIYNDEGSSGITMSGNVVVDTDSGGYHLHFGKDNVLEGNIFAGGDAAEIRVTKPEADTNLTVRGNLLASKSKKPLDQLVAGPQIKFDRNEVASGESGKGVEVDKCGTGCTVSDADVKTGATPTDIRSTNPAWTNVINAAVATWKGGAVAAKGGASTSAAAAVGNSVQASNAAASTDSTVQSRSLALVAEAPKAITAPAADLVVDIAATSPAGRPANLQYAPKDKPEAIQIETQSGAPNGKCLAFNDGPAFANRWEPYASALLNHTQGTTVVDVDLKIDAATVMLLEWRDGSSPYLTGPSVRISAAGAEVGGKVVAPVAAGKWTHIRMSASLGVDSPTWNLELSSADGKKSSVNGLAVKSGGWKRLNTLVLSSDAVVESHACLGSLKVANGAPTR